MGNACLTATRPARTERIDGSPLLYFPCSRVSTDITPPSVRRRLHFACASPHIPKYTKHKRCVSHREGVLWLVSTVIPLTAATLPAAPVKCTHAAPLGRNDSCCSHAMPMIAHTLATSKYATTVQTVGVPGTCSRAMPMKSQLTLPLPARAHTPSHDCQLRDTCTVYTLQREWSG